MVAVNRMMADTGSGNVTNTLSTEIKIDDDIYRKICEDIATWCEELQKYLDQYILNMDTILQCAITEGDTHDALKLFTEYASYLSDALGGSGAILVETIGEECKCMGANYISEIDEADSDLYEVIDE